MDETTIKVVMEIVVAVIAFLSALVSIFKAHQAKESATDAKASEAQVKRLFR